MNIACSSECGMLQLLKAAQIIWQDPFQCQKVFQGIAHGSACFSVAKPATATGQPLPLPSPFPPHKVTPAHRDAFPSDPKNKMAAAVNACFVFMLGSHLPMSRNLHFAALLGGLQSPIKWHNEKKGRKKKRNEQQF